MKVKTPLTLGLVLFVLSACHEEREEELSSTAQHHEVQISEHNNVDWVKHGLNNAETRFSPLSQINSSNVAELGLAWYKDLPSIGGQEATPIIVNGIMYVSSAWSHVYALNAVTGEQLWHYNPKVDKSVLVKGCCGPVNRGVAYEDGVVYVGAFDGRLIAIDADTGTEKWQQQTTDVNKAYTITGAPRVVKDMVLIGNGGGEFGVRGYVSAYDKRTGEMRWRFFTTPGNPNQPQENPIHEKTLSTWSGEFWKMGGGGTVWDSMAYDPELNLVYIGTGNSSPWNPRIRTQGEGDNLFVSSIVALDPDTGRYVWHYQTTPQDAWDYTATQHLILTELLIDGEKRKVIMQAPKNGFFYVLDRANGEFISGKNYVPVNWAKGLDEKGRPIVNQEAKYWLQDKPSLVTPAWTGGHNWHPMSYSDKTGLVYFSAQEMSFPYKDDPNFDINNPLSLAVNLGVDVLPASFPDNPLVVAAIKDATKGHLLAWDPVKQEERWRVQYPGPWNGGVLSTAGDVVFQGTAAGYFNAYDANTGAKLWEYPVQTGVVAAPVTFSVDSEQYVSLVVGWGGIFARMTGPLTTISNENPINRSRILTFKLKGNEHLPSVKERLRDLPDWSALTINTKGIVQGHVDYERYCAGCHGTGAVGGGVVPDLRYSPLVQNKEAFTSVVADGILSANGMVGFSKELSSERIAQLRDYIIDRNRAAHKSGDTKRLSR